MALRGRNNHYQIGVRPERFIRLRHEMNSGAAVAQFVPTFTTPRADRAERRLPLRDQAVQRPQIRPQNIARSDNSDSHWAI